MKAAFREQKLVGVSAEQRVADALYDHRGARKVYVRRMAGKAAYDLDVWTEDCASLVEVKNEDAMAHTGNLCIELHQRRGDGLRKPSGLLNSSANVWIHTLGEECAIYSANDMRNLVYDLMGAGDLQERPFSKSDNANSGVLVPLDCAPFCSVIEVFRFEHLWNAMVWRNP